MDAAGDEGSCRAYPADVEAWWVERARRAAGGAPAEEAIARATPAAAAASDRFTTERPPEFRDYGDEETLLAYGLLFFPQSWCRVRFPLAEAADLRGWAVPRDRPVRVLDLGAGTGAAGLSAARWLLARGAASVALDAVDHSPSALEVLRELARDVRPPRGEIALATRVADVRALREREDAAFPGPHDLVLASCVVNEAFPGPDDPASTGWLRSLAASLAPGGLLVVVEPALRTTSLRLRRVAADALERSGGALTAWGPQLGPAPWRPREDGRFWPHEVRRWRLPTSVALLNRRLRRSLGEVTFSFATLGRGRPAPLDPSARVFRLTSPVARARGRLVWTGLGGDGVERPYEGLTRSLSADGLESLGRFERGDVLEVAAVEPVGAEGGLRVPSLSTLAVLHHPE